MIRIIALPCLLALLSFGAFAESEPKPRFEVADVHNSPHDIQPFVRGPFYSTGRYEFRFATMLDLIRTAYNVDPEKIAGGPTWLEMDRFDVFAKIPSNSSAESRRLMLQSLLADRFHLTMHEDNQPMPAYTLLPGKHSGLKESDGSAPGGCNFKVENQPTAPPAPGTPIQLPTIVYTCKATTMAGFASNMLNIPGAAQYFNNVLVVDKSGITGSYDFAFGFTPKFPATLKVVGEPTTFFEAIEKQLGMKLELSTVPMPVHVVDKVDQKPTPNSAEAMKSFPPLPTEFEVASLKPVDPSQTNRNAQPDIKNGRLYLPNFPVKVLIQVAFNINGDELMSGAQKWMDEDRYDILAKAPSEVAIGDLTPNRNTVPVNIDALRPMLANLIKERFKMEYHMETRPVTAYTLTAVKPKLTKSDPTSRTRWKEGPLPENKGNKNANAALGRLVTCQNVTMAQFAELLPGIAPGYLRTDVIDNTGLEGGYNFTFSFSPIGIVQQQQRQAAANPAEAESADTAAAISLFDSISKQLGLKLETVKRPMQVLVIDKIERKPTEN
ncbi:MAG TPA: TIGR03435 family protein [Candidatus Solibacter sp.]|nr:TIGR03435 family protein [Candidatus Solibacter sp.]